MRKRTCDPAVEINGYTVQAYFHGSHEEVFRRAFKKYGITEIVVEKWYPVAPLLEVLYEIGSNPQTASSLVSLGVKIAEFGVEPTDLQKADLPLVLENWERHMYTNIRNGEVGHIRTEKISDTSYRIVQSNIFPDDLCYGLAYGFARTHLPLGTNFKVWYEDYAHRIDNGDADETVICVSWDVPVY